jgi:hypothetical protein
MNSLSKFSNFSMTRNEMKNVYGGKIVCRVVAYKKEGGHYYQWYSDYSTCTGKNADECQKDGCGQDCKKYCWGSN